MKDAVTGSLSDNRRLTERRGQPHDFVRAMIAGHRDGELVGRPLTGTRWVSTARWRRFGNSGTCWGNAAESYTWHEKRCKKW